MFDTKSNGYLKINRLRRNPLTAAAQPLARGSSGTADIDRTICITSFGFYAEELAIELAQLDGFLCPVNKLELVTAAWPLNNNLRSRKQKMHFSSLSIVISGNYLKS
jgi:hypothetical protein